MQSLARFGLCVVLASCVSIRRSPVDPFPGGGEVEIQYSSRLSGQGGQVGVVASQPNEERPGAPTAVGATPRAIVQVACKLIAMESDDAVRMLGGNLRGQRVARTVAENALSKLEEDRQASVITAPRLTLFDGNRGEIRVANQLAFVEAFEVTQVEDSLIADPVVATVMEGIRLEARPTIVAQQGSVRLELALHTADLVGSIRETTTRLPGASSEVTIQQPLCFTQRVSTSVELGPEEVLVIGGLPTKEPGRVLVAMVSTKAAAPGSALATERSRRVAAR